MVAAATHAGGNVVQVYILWKADLPAGPMMSYSRFFDAKLDG
jgi:hypothetical protein